MIDKKTQELLFRVGVEVANRAKVIAPIVSGNLRNDIQVFDDDLIDGVIAIGNTQITPYAKFVHDGTKPYEIRPKRKKALKTPYGVYKKVNHPGIKANPYLEKALKDVVSSGVIEQIADAVALEDEVIKALNLDKFKSEWS
jgi:hypothetical protein